MKRGFTLIELLAVITIIGLLSLIVVPIVDTIIKDNNQELYDIQIKNIEDAAKNWASNNILSLPEDINDTMSITICDLEKEGFIEIVEKDNMYYLNFTYNYARIEAIVEKDEINNAVLNASYILSTIKYNKDIVKLMLEEDYFTNKTGKYNNYDNSSPSEKFKLEKEDSNEG